MRTAIDWKGYLSLGLVIAGLIVAAVREFDHLETRVRLLEAREVYTHGNYDLPRGAK